MDRATWLQGVRREAEERYDTLHAVTYDEQEWATITPTHGRFVARLIDFCPPKGRILDAACGTGKYFPLVLESGCRVVGTDQSAGMLAGARAKYPEVPLEKVGLQELAFDSDFDTVMCIDALEFVSPEDWPLVLGNLRRALRPGGHLYFTVELCDDQELERAYAQATAEGLPVVFGEHTSPGTGYHYYPPLVQVAAWVAEASLRTIEEGSGDEYYHLLARAGGAAPASRRDEPR